MKFFVALILLSTVACTFAAPAPEPLDTRSVKSFFNSLGNKIKDVAKKVVDYIKSTFDKVINVKQLFTTAADKTRSAAQSLRNKIVQKAKDAVASVTSAISDYVDKHNGLERAISALIKAGEDKLIWILEKVESILFNNKKEIESFLADLEMLAGNNGGNHCTESTETEIHEYAKNAGDVASACVANSQSPLVTLYGNAKEFVTIVAGKLDDLYKSLMKCVDKDQCRTLWLKGAALVSELTDEGLDTKQSFDKASTAYTCLKDQQEELAQKKTEFEEKIKACVA